ncbi:MAG TPA: hypothetical protein VK932_30880 [Kofleriaceae bacterium]|nr:hypothetical protein [Kofleriaceae bacterium]
MTMTSAELIAWSSLAERRARRWWSSRVTVALAAGGAIAAWVWWREAAGLASSSQAWLAAVLVAFALAFLRVPFHLYWRPDAALLAQLPIEGGPLLDAALVRCLRAAAATTLAALLGALPFLRSSHELAARHALVALALGAAAAWLLPAVTTGAAAIVTVGQRDARIQQVRAVTGAAAAPGPPSTALLGALPGLAATAILLGILLISPWLVGAAPHASPATILVAIAATSVASLAITRATAPRVMGTILRDVSALDRQHLATLEIRPPTAIERAIARLAGDAALPYGKDARLMRRRFPMAFALGSLAFLVLAIVGLSRPADPVPWLTAVIGAAAIYAIALAGRLGRPPIELPRLSATLPIAAAAVARAKLAWLLGWWTIFVLAPGLFAALRQADPVPGLALLGGGTAIALAAGRLRP